VHAVASPGYAARQSEHLRSRLKSSLPAVLCPASGQLLRTRLLFRPPTGPLVTSACWLSCARNAPQPHGHSATERAAEANHGAKYRPPAAVPGRAQPTGCLACAGTVRALCQVAAEHDLVIISDEIYRDLTYETVAPSPARF